MTLNRTAFAALIASTGLALATGTEGGTPAVTGTPLACDQFRAMFAAAAAAGDRAGAALGRAANGTSATVLTFPGCTWA
ncbi:hypothetical protein LO763_22565 [Glycomyces sp. A-F 0318]|uniref:hypothetical protein n=1 Tax=Glycomyces amatae TaxID=2881355 RepID=UPI001E3B4A99|nr:hypothetical protein [Glycomyces amatae]MCD0446403.1 hypothetical protein [Glycomyces amatae]